MKRLAVVVFACTLALGLLAPAIHVHAAYAPDDQAQAIVGLINDYRGSLGLQPVSLADDLGEAAQHHSDDMATNNYFSHTLADGSSPEQNIRNFGFTGSTWGENIAAGMSSAPDALQTWKNSPEHDSILRDPDFQEVGIGRSYNDNSQYGWYWTADFGGGAQTAPSTIPDAAPPVTDASNTTSPVTTTTDINGVKTKKVDGVSVQKQQAPSDGGNSTANAEPSPIVMGDLDLRGTTTTIVVPPSSSTGDASGSNNVNDTPPPAPPVANGGGTSQSGRATASGSDGSITYNASDNGDGNQIITSDNTGNAGDTSGGGDAAPQNPNQQVASCGDFGSWYDAQNAYEAAGGTDGDPALANSLDPDWDGIACEEMMTS
ncbi:MAG TPA: CAP domain-containing protein [Thermomicrobiales bacterium]|nr:CAP domain-containing protein [Thermomicrobiales bacterium]